jgi:high-affinity iron transporter
MQVLARTLEAAVVMLREGIEASLVIAIVLAYLRRAGRGELARVVYGALGAALGASVLAAVLVRWLGLDPENEIWEGTVMLVAAGLVASLVVWMHRAGRRMRTEMEARLTGLIAARGGRRAALGLFVFTFVMVFREGVETVLFLGALSGAIGANPLYNALGGSVGLLLAALFGVLLLKGSVRIDLGRFFRVTELVLLLLVAKLVANGLHEFFEHGFLPSNETVLSVIGLLTREATSVALLALLIALPAAMLVLDAWTQPVAAATAAETAVEQRRRRAAVRAARVWSTAAGVIGIAVAALLVLSVAATARGFDPPPTRVEVNAPILTIPLGAVGEPPLTKFEATVDGVNVRFFAMRKPGGGVTVALDACAICPLEGYHMSGDHLECGNCGAPVATDTIGIAGGCNPIPLEAEVRGDTVLVHAEALTRARARFAHRG